MTIKNEDDFPFLLSSLIKFIDKIKKTEDSKDLSLLDIIIEFSRKEDVELMIIGEAINSDVYLKSFIQKDCEMRKIFRVEIPEMW